MGGGGDVEDAGGEAADDQAAGGVGGGGGAGPDEVVDGNSAGELMGTGADGDEAFQKRPLAGAEHHVSEQQDDDHGGADEGAGDGEDGHRDVEDAEQLLAVDMAGEGIGGEGADDINSALGGREGEVLRSAPGLDFVHVEEDSVHEEVGADRAEGLDGIDFGEETDRGARGGQRGLR